VLDFVFLGGAPGRRCVPSHYTNIHFATMVTVKRAPPAPHTGSKAKSPSVEVQLGISKVDATFDDVGAQFTDCIRGRLRMRSDVKRDDRNVHDVDIRRAVYL